MAVLIVKNPAFAEFFITEVRWVFLPCALMTSLDGDDALVSGRPWLVS